eukprot:8937036-Alexandrium_andersonii.AAC.1
MCIRDRLSLSVSTRAPSTYIPVVATGNDPWICRTWGSIQHAKKSVAKAQPAISPERAWATSPHAAPNLKNRPLAYCASATREI